MWLSSSTMRTWSRSLTLMQHRPRAVLPSSPQKPCQTVDYCLPLAARDGYTEAGRLLDARCHYLDRPAELGVLAALQV